MGNYDIVSVDVGEGGDDLGGIEPRHAVSESTRRPQIGEELSPGRELKQHVEGTPVRHGRVQLDYERMRQAEQDVALRLSVLHLNTKSLSKHTSKYRHRLVAFNDPNNDSNQEICTFRIFYGVKRCCYFINENTIKEGSLANAFFVNIAAFSSLILLPNSMYCTYGYVHVWDTTTSMYSEKNEEKCTCLVLTTRFMGIILRA